MGQQLIIGGNADGSIYAMKQNTGEMVWGFKLSQRGLNTSVIVEGTKVYASHSEENIDTTTMGRVVCIGATGTGDVSKTHELWRYDGVNVGYASPTIHAGHLYVVDNSANVHAVNADTGELHWQHSIGKVGKGSPVWADGKLYVTEVNGIFTILEPSKDGCESLSAQEISRARGRSLRRNLRFTRYCRWTHLFHHRRTPLLYRGDKIMRNAIPIYAVLIACLLVAGCASKEMAPEPVEMSTAPAVSLLLTPAEALTSGDPVAFSVIGFDANGKRTSVIDAVEWMKTGLTGTLQDGTFTPDESAEAHAGTVTVQSGEMKAMARLRVIPSLPWTEDFEAIELEKTPSHWIGATGKFFVREKNGNKVLVKPPARVGLDRSNVYLGPATMENYQIQVDLMGTKNKRRLPDMGLIANRYTLDMQGRHQRLQNPFVGI